VTAPKGGDVSSLDVVETAIAIIDEETLAWKNKREVSRPAGPKGAPELGSSDTPVEERK
jgi:hypothetical protein